MRESSGSHFILHSEALVRLTQEATVTSGGLYHSIGSAANTRAWTKSLSLVPDQHVVRSGGELGEVDDEDDGESQRDHDLIHRRCPVASHDEERQRCDQQSIAHPGPDPYGHLLGPGIR